MTRYFFHIEDGDSTIADEDGVDLRDDDAAREEAILAVRDLVAEALRQGKILNGRAMRVTDAGGRDVAHVAFREVIRLE